MRRRDIVTDWLILGLSWIWVKWLRLLRSDGKDRRGSVGRGYGPR
jgi:hypothetical protein